MLILTRKVGETIIIAGKVRVQVLDLKDFQVRVGITAPDDIRIRREEALPDIHESDPQQNKDKQ